MPDIKEIYSVYRGSLTEDDKRLLMHAYDFAMQAHDGQVRASGEPYFNHVFATAKNLASFGMSPITIVAGFLHDTIEDTKVTEESLKAEFGDEIVFLVNGVTKLGKLKYRGRERHIESLKKFFIAVAQDMRVVAIKFADRLHNIQTLEHIPKEKATRIALETIEIYAPLAYRLGMGKLVGELQDAAFPFAFPKESAMVNELLKQKKRLNEQYLEKIWRTLKKEMAKHSIRDITTHQRVKGRYSLWRKLQRKEMDIEKVYDIVALRIIVPEVEDCYRLLGVIHSMWRPLPARIKDYIALPKVNGYQSLHTTVFSGDGGIAEIQIRTPKMHEFAEYGFAAHLVYKEHGSNIINNNSLDWILELKELQENEEDQDKLLQQLKTDFFGSRIFVFTPEGDVIDLPQGSSAIDFAYTIHSAIGNQAESAIVNGKMSPLKTVLNSGDIVEIKTNKKGHPSGKWLAYVKTTIARKHIERYERDHSLWNRVFHQ